MKEDAKLSDPEYIFVYGTLRKGAGHPMNRALEAQATYAGPGRFPGKLYDLGSYPAAVPCHGVPRHEGGMVIGDLYCLHRPERILPLLDRYEGCTDMDGSGADYRREARTVQISPMVPMAPMVPMEQRVPMAPFPAGKHVVEIQPDEKQPGGKPLDRDTVQAWIYLYNRPTAGLKVIPGGDYLLSRHQQ